MTTELLAGIGILLVAFMVVFGLFAFGLVILRLLSTRERNDK